MAVRTGQQFIDGLRDDREVYYNGQRVADVTTFEPFKASVVSLARLYDLQHDARYRDTLTVECPTLGERIARAFEKQKIKSTNFFAQLYINMYIKIFRIIF